MRGASSAVAKLRRAAQRVVLDQAIVAPVFASGLFISRGLIAGMQPGLHVVLARSTQVKDNVRVMNVQERV